MNINLLKNKEYIKPIGVDVIHMDEELNIFPHLGCRMHFST